MECCRFLPVQISANSLEKIQSLVSIFELVNVRSGGRERGGIKDKGKISISLDGIEMVIVKCGGLIVRRGVRVT